MNTRKYTSLIPAALRGWFGTLAARWPAEPAPCWTEYLRATSDR